MLSRAFELVFAYIHAHAAPYTFLGTTLQVIVLFISLLVAMLVRMWSGSFNKHQQKLFWKWFKGPGGFFNVREWSSWKRIGGWKYWVLTSFLDSIQLPLQPVAQQMGSGPFISIMSQSMVVFVLLTSLPILRKQYNIFEAMSVCVLTLAIVLDIIRESESSSEQTTSAVWLMLCIMFIAGLLYTMMEYMFRTYEAEQREDTLAYYNDLNSSGQLMTKKCDGEEEDNDKKSKNLYLMRILPEKAEDREKVDAAMRKLLVQKIDDEKNSHADAKGEKVLLTKLPAEVEQHVVQMDFSLCWIQSAIDLVFFYPWILPVAINIIFYKDGGIQQSDYWGHGFQCWANDLDKTTLHEDFAHRDHGVAGLADDACTKAWQYWLLFVVFDVFMNFMLFLVTLRSSALTAFASLKVGFGLSIFLYYLHWPFVNYEESKPTKYGLVATFMILVGFVILKAGDQLTKHLERPVKRGAINTFAWPVLGTYRPLTAQNDVGYFEKFLNLVHIGRRMQPCYQTTDELATMHELMSIEQKTRESSEQKKVKEDSSSPIFIEVKKSSQVFQSAPVLFNPQSTTPEGQREAETPSVTSTTSD